jgi:hypothetical protein
MGVMSKVEIIERRIQTYQRELQKLRLQLKIARLEQSPSGEKNQASDDDRGTSEKR